jgi:hypothetical protein
MKRLMQSKTFSLISICTILSFLSSICFISPAGADMGIGNRDRLAEDVAALVKKAFPLMDETAVVSETEKLISAVMDQKMQPQQGDCAAAQLIFSNGLLLLLFTVVVSEVFSQDKCTNEACIGDLCVCTEDDTSSPLGGFNNLLRRLAVTMIIIGVLASFNCVSDDATAADNYSN